jgi:mannose-6-phosphate isomerase
MDHPQSAQSGAAQLPALLRADNFTPVARTPWGGTRIATHYKRAHLPPATHTPTIVGESWEVSIEPDFPARLENGVDLRDYIAQAPEAVLGEEHRRGRSGTALLVKLLDTAEPLSVQIHPGDDYQGLSPDECGKPESWYVVERSPGAGLYLGFRRGVDERAVRRALEAGASLEPLMRFVSVEPGDFFVIDAGMPHAIGAGLTLVEPQHVLPGLRGVTYRYWDWNRRYDATGQPSATGAARTLHVEDALAVTDWARFDRDDFIETVRTRAGAAEREKAAAALALLGGAGLQSRFLQVTRIAGQGGCALPYRDKLQSITVLEGSVAIGELRVDAGRSAIVPACAANLPLALDRAHAVACAVA